MRDNASAHADVTVALDAAQPNGAGVGVVVEVSEQSLALRGKRVLVGPFDPCGACPVCRAGSPAACAMPLARREPARRIRASSRWLVELGDGLELPIPAAAAVAGDVALAYTLYARASLSPADPAVVLGSGPVARFLVEILVAKSIAPIVVVDPAAAAWRSELLARKVAVATRERAVHDVADALGARGTVERPRRVFATDAAALPTACELASARAVLVVAAGGGTPSVTGELLAREVTVIGVAGAHPDLILETAALCARGEIDLLASVSEDPADHTRATIIPAVRLPAEG